MLKLILIVVLIVMLLGGLLFYIRKTVKLTKEFVDFAKVVFMALKDKKINQAEREAIIKEYADMKPIAKSLKLGFIEDLKEIGEDIKSVYEAIRDKIKNR